MFGIRSNDCVAVLSIVAFTACESAPNPGTVPTATSSATNTTTPLETGSSSTTSSSATSGSPSTTTTVTTGSTSTTTTGTTSSASVATSSSSVEVSSTGELTSQTADTIGAGSSEDGETTVASNGCASALLCDDFDDDTVGMAPGQPWKSESNDNGNQVVISSERAFSGDKSVHVSNSQGQYKRAYFAVDGAPVFPGAGAELYGRLMMWLDVSPADGVHWTFIQGEGPSDDGSYDIFYRYGGQHQGKLMANFETQNVASDCWNHSQTVMPTKTWSCLEWRFNTATDEMQFWLDGNEVADLHVVGQGNEGSGCVAESWSKLWPAPQQFEVLRLGLEKYQEDGPLNLWIDDVAVGTTRVGCP